MTVSCTNPTRRALFSGVLAFSLLQLSSAYAETEQVKAEQYFPEGILWDNAKADASLRQHFTAHLKALQEPSLFPAPHDKEAYRFTWLRSFHSPMAFRIEVGPTGTGTLSVKRTSGKGGYEPGKINLNTSVFIDHKTVAELRQELADMDFWGKPVWHQSVGLDGARWVLEANAGGLYKIVHRWATPDPEFCNWCLKLVTLSGVEVGEIY
jgi:hypothetical protein